ncbi:hypothetical protein ADICEAN_04262 [Cesiribacter andamanensis AMV16]|uniref:Uncharacterized protein n=1 Tax=Cesiribacter andamanensis AMV16 TaxID=1279009 RepID=M7NQ04_9BACT|nr:hypothetical protein ADICEAN_04262 [Cesiribacter andamanensis AMV16]
MDNDMMGGIHTELVKVAELASFARLYGNAGIRVHRRVMRLIGSKLSLLKAASRSTQLLLMEVLLPTF